MKRSSVSKKMLEELSISKDFADLSSDQLKYRETTYLHDPPTTDVLHIISNLRRSSRQPSDCQTLQVSPTRGEKDSCDLCKSGGWWEIARAKLRATFTAIGTP